MSASKSDYVTRLDSLVKDRYGTTEDGVPGAAIVVMKGDSIIYEHYTGVSSILTNRRIDASTTFNIASISKQFTVVGLLQLAARGLIDIDEPMSSFVDYPQSFWHEITPAHLASQSSGLPDSRDRSDRLATVYADDDSSIEFFPRVKSLKFRPGSAYDYVNPTFILLARLIEQKSGECFVDYQQKHIFEPAGMYSTYYFNPLDSPENEAHAYVRNGDGWEEYDYGEETFFATRPDGGIYSTARDMVAWYRAQRHSTVLSHEWLQQAFTPRVSVADSQFCNYQQRPFTWYGFGWFIEERPGMPFKIYHTGDNGGFQALAERYPDDDVSVIILENRNDCDRRLFDEQIERILIDAGILHKTNGFRLYDMNL